MQVTNYKCPSCTGPLHFVGESGKLECEYCGAAYDVKEIEAMYAAQEAAAAEAKPTEWEVEAAQWTGEEGMKAYSCPSCGARLLCDGTTAATSCPYCGNPTVVPGQFSGTLRPDYILPFKLSRQAAKEALQKHCKGKILLPDAFRKENHLEEIKGVYVPFWLFDAEADVSMTFRASNSRTVRQGDYLITDTDHYEVGRAGKIAFQRVPVDGSSKMPDDFMDSIEPYDYGELKEFSTAYLPGFLADQYDVDAEAAAPRAEERCRATAVRETRKTVTGYAQVHTEYEQVDLCRGPVKYVLLPVWVLSTRWKDKTYLFAMNGQTGKMVGDLPADPGKLRLWFWGTALGASAILSLLLSGPLGRMIAGWIG